MKKAYILFLLLGCLFVATACSDDDEKEVLASLEIVKSDVTFDANAGTGTIEVRSTAALTATSSESWCTVSVSGNVVTVGVSALADMNSRSALVTITDGTASVEVPVHQAGSIWSWKGQDSFFALAEETTFSIPVKTSCEYTAQPSDSWISGEAGDGVYIIRLAENTGDFRQGTMTFVSVLGQTQTFSFTQLGANGLAGEYTARWQAYDNESDEDVTPIVWYEADGVTVAPTEDGFLIENLSDFPIPLMFDEESGVYIPNATLLGSANFNVGLRYIYTTCMGTQLSDGEFGYMGWGAGINICFDCAKNADGKLELTFVDKETWSGFRMDGFMTYLFKSTTLSSANRGEGYWDMFLSLSLTMK